MYAHRFVPRTFGPLVALWVVIAALSGCGSGPTQTAIGTQTATTAPTSTATTMPPTPTGVPAGWTYYLDPQYHFALDAPASWRSFTDSTSNGGYYEFLDMGLAPDGLGTFLYIQVTDLADNVTSNNLLKMDEMQFCTSAKTTTVANFPAVVADHSHPNNSSAPPMLERQVVANGLFYDISFYRSQFDTEPLDTLRQQLGPLYAQILATFQPGPGEPGNVICAS